MCDAREPHIKAKLTAHTEEALAAGILGAPSFTAGAGKLFSGAGRLDQVLVRSLR